MNVKILQNFAAFRLAVKLFDKGIAIKQILNKVNRSRSWFYKWHERFIKGGYSQLKDRPKTPLHLSSNYDRKDVTLVLRIRKRLEKASVGLIHAKIVQQEIKEEKLMKRIPSVRFLGSIINADSAFTIYDLEDVLKEAAGISLEPLRKKNSKRKFEGWTQYLQACGRKIVETSGSMIERLLPKSIHAVTAEGFELKVLLFVLASSFSFVL